MIKCKNCGEFLAEINGKWWHVVPESGVFRVSYVDCNRPEPDEEMPREF